MALETDLGTKEIPATVLDFTLDYALKETNEIRRLRLIGWY